MAATNNLVPVVFLSSDQKQQQLSYEIELNEAELEDLLDNPSSITSRIEALVREKRLYSPGHTLYYSYRENPDSEEIQDNLWDAYNSYFLPAYSPGLQYPTIFVRAKLNDTQLSFLPIPYKRELRAKASSEQAASSQANRASAALIRTALIKTKGDPQRAAQLLANRF
jgi:hypothetical protein